MFGFPVLMNDCTLPTGFRLKVSWNFEQWLIKRMIQYDSCDVWFHTITLHTVLPMQRNGFPGTSWKARESTVLGGPGPWRPQLSYHVFFNTPTFDQNESIFRPHWTTLTLLLSCPRANKCSDLCSHRLSMAVFFYRICNLYHFILPFLETVCFWWLCSYANDIYGHPSSASVYSVFSVCCLNTMQHVLYVMYSLYSILYCTVYCILYCILYVYCIWYINIIVCCMLCTVCIKDHENFHISSYCFQAFLSPCSVWGSLSRRALSRYSKIAAVTTQNKYWSFQHKRLLSATDPGLKKIRRWRCVKGRVNISA
jgi:hypothetical protein